MKCYLLSGNNITCTTGEFTEPYIAVWELDSINSQLVEAGALVEYKDGNLVITPAGPIIADRPTRILSQFAFVDRFTAAEYKNVLEATKVNDDINFFWQKFILAQEINLDFPELVAGVNLLEQAGLIAVGRAAEILG